MDFERAKLEQVKREFELQYNIREKKVTIKGRVNEEIATLIEYADLSLEELIATPEGKANYEAIENFVTELGIDSQETREAFETGLKYNIKAAYKSELIDGESSDEDINTLIGAYTLSFRNALSKFKKDQDKGITETPRDILEIAKRMYLLPSNIINDLRKEYEDNSDIENSMIIRAAIYNPKNPKTYIEKTLTTISNLRKKYKTHPDVEEGMIKRAAVHNPKDPEATIEKILEDITKLKKEYKDDENVNNSMIKRAAINNPINPDAAIDKALEVIPKLKEKYKNNSDVDGWMIKRAAINNPINPDAAIDKALKDILNLRKKYPEADDRIIKHSAVHYPINPETALKKALEKDYNN